MNKLLVLTLIVIVNVLVEAKANATLINPIVVQDTTLQFLGSVDYMGPLVNQTFRFKPATVDPLIPANFVTTNWVVTVAQGRFDLVPPAVANDIQISAIHQVPPPAPLHGEGVGGLLGPLEFSQGNLGVGVNTNPGATVVDAGGNVRILTTQRPHGSHRDVLQARVDSIGPAVSRISIQADHLVGPGNPPPVPIVPEPSTLLLLSSGLAGLIGFARRRTRGSPSSPR